MSDAGPTDSKQPLDDGKAPVKSVRAQSRATLPQVLPTDRVTPSKQMAVLRAYAAASGPDNSAVSNNEVAAILSDLVASSVSLCNPFFVDAGLLIREGSKQRPVPAVLEYLHAFEWNKDTAAHKLRGVFSEGWAAKTLLPKLAFRQLSKDEAIQFLADESKATKGHKRNLECLLEFLQQAGVIRLEGNTVAKPSAAPGDNQPEGTLPLAQENGNVGKPSERQRNNAEQEDATGDDVHKLVLPIPGKPSVVVLIPKSLDAEDWAMFQDMFTLYVSRWKGFAGAKSSDRKPGDST